MNGGHATPIIEVLARAVIIYNGAILLCKPRNKANGDYYYLPGGHVEHTEDSVKALMREIKEETAIDVTSTRFIGIVENQFTQNRDKKHEINIVFEAHSKSAKINNREDHIVCEWVAFENFEQGNVLPALLKKHVTAWRRDNKTFFGSEKE